MEDTSRTSDNLNVASPSSTGSGGGGSSVRDMAKLLAMSVFSRAKKRKHDQIQTRTEDASNDNVSNTSHLAPVTLPKITTSLSSPNISAHIEIGETNSAPLRHIHSRGDLKSTLCDDSSKNKGRDYDGASNTILDARGSPILKNLLHPTASSSSFQSAPYDNHPKEAKILKTLLNISTSHRLNLNNTMPIYTNASQNHTNKIPPKEVLNPSPTHEDSKSSDPSKSKSFNDIAKKSENISLRFLCCFSTLVLKPPASHEIAKKPSKLDEKCVSYVCYAFDRGTLMCNNGAPTDFVRHILTQSKKTGSKIPCTFVYDDSTLKRRSYSRFLIAMKSQGWEVNVPKPGTARDVLEYIRCHEAFFLPDEGLSKVMSYVKQNYNSQLIRETIPMIEGDTMSVGSSDVSTLRPYDLQKIGEGKDYYLLRSCTVKRNEKRPGNITISPVTATGLPTTVALRTSHTSRQTPPPTYQHGAVAHQQPSRAPSSNNPGDNIQITVLPDPNAKREKSETLVLPSMGGATITLHSASSEVVDTSYNSTANVQRKSKDIPSSTYGNSSTSRKGQSADHLTSTLSSQSNPLNIENGVHPYPRSSSNRCLLLI